MELQIKDLVDSIKKEGIDKASQESEKIIAQANTKAKSIVEKASLDAAKILEDAQKEIQVLRENAYLTAQQALRDATLSFKEQIKKEYEKILSSKINLCLDDKTLAKLILAAVNDEDVSKYTVEVSCVSETLKAELASQIKSGLEIRPVKDVRYGFKLASKDGSGFFDCTDDQITQMLKPFMENFNI